MRIQCLPVGSLGTNAYIVCDENRTDAVVIDPGAEAGAIQRALQGRTIAAILLTHGHFDHISAVDALREGAFVAIHALDAPMLISAQGNLSCMLGKGFAIQAADRLLCEEDAVEAAGLTFEVLHTPGHTPGSVCYRCGGVLFSGDTLFSGGYGRYDLPGGDWDALSHSLRRVLALTGVERVCPGHGEETTLERERRRL